MRYLGIDYGAKRVGVAVSDTEGTFAFPLVVLENTPELLAEVAEICKENDVAIIVVGESQDFSFKDNKIMKEIRQFLPKLEKFGFDVRLHPEFMTSQQAEQITGKTEMHDASAAALILQSYLDTYGK